MTASENHFVSGCNKKIIFLVLVINEKNTHEN